jgi:DNA-binding NtrC family response regulator
LRDVMQEVERMLLSEAIRQAGGDRMDAALSLNIEIGELNEKLANYGIPTDDSDL